MEKKKKPSLEERLEADPEFKAAFDYLNEDRMVERIKQGYRHELERKSSRGGA